MSLEAGRTLVLDARRTLALARDLGLGLVGLRGSS